jgi:aminomethyltransferase
MGEVVFRGADALASLQRLFTNDLAKCADGQAQYGCLCREDGGIVDDVVVYRRAADDLLVCVNAGNRQKDFAWLHGHATGAEVANESDDWAQLALQGPLAQQLLQRLTNVNLSALKPFRFAAGEVSGIAGCIVARTGYTGEDGFEVFCPPGEAPRLWDAILATGAHEKVVPCGLGARDSLRLEMAYRLYGQDMTDDTSPLEAGLGWVVKPAKGQFIGREAIEALRARGLTRKLVGFEMAERAVPRHGYRLMSAGAPVGVVTSGSFGPSVERSIGMGYVPVALSAVGSELGVEIRGATHPARVVKTPFHPSHTKKA